MLIGEVSALSELPVKTIRFYEGRGLIRPARRAENGYRLYSERDVHLLLFLKRARGLGFSIDACQELMSLYEDENRSSGEVKALAARHLGAIEQKITVLESLRHALTDLVERCAGDDRPDCPIIDTLAGHSPGSGIDGSEPSTSPNRRAS